jgi:pyruvate dehydrogenase E1 component beta subunit
MPEISFAQALHDALEEEMERDESVFVLGENIEMGYPFGVTQGLHERFGAKRAFDTPISEASFVGAATGAAITGMRPVVDIMFDNLLYLAMEQIVNQAARLQYMTGGRLKVPVVIRSASGFWGSFAAQHSDNAAASFVSVPGLTVVAPSTPRDAKGLLKSSIRYDSPVLFLEHKLLYSSIGHVPAEEELIPLGRADVKREGIDVTVVAISYMVSKALEAAKLLLGEDIEVEVVDPRTLVPMDEATILDSVRKTGKLVIAEDGPKTGGVGAEIAAVVAEEAIYDLEAPIKRVAARDCPLPFSPVLEEYVVPGSADIVAAIMEILN